MLGQVLPIIVIETHGHIVKIFWYSRAKLCLLEEIFTMGQYYHVDPVTHGVVEFTNFRIKNASQWFNEYFYFGKITTSKTLRDIWDDDLPSLFGEI